MLLQKPKIRRIGARFENMFFLKKGILSREGCPDILDTALDPPVAEVTQSEVATVYSTLDELCNTEHVRA